MISKADMIGMKKDIIDIIKDWSTKVEVWIPLDKSLQPNWSDLMHESNDIQYDKHVDIDAERIDIFDSQLSVELDGDRYDGKVMVRIASTIDIDEDSKIILDGKMWTIKSIKRLLGEYIITIIRVVGDNGCQGQSTWSGF